MLVTVTYLQPTSLRTMLRVNGMTGPLARAASRTPGFVRGRARVDHRGGMWTLTGWVDGQALRAYRDGDAHGPAIPLIGELTRASGFATFTHPGEALPTWTEACGRLAEQAPALAGLESRRTLLQRPIRPSRRRRADLATADF